MVLMVLQGIQDLKVLLDHLESRDLMDPLEVPVIPKDHLELLDILVTQECQDLRDIRVHKAPRVRMVPMDLKVMLDPRDHKASKALVETEVQWVHMDSKVLPVIKERKVHQVYLVVLVQKARKGQLVLLDPLELLELRDPLVKMEWMAMLEILDLEDHRDSKVVEDHEVEMAPRETMANLVL